MVSTLINALSLTFKRNGTHSNSFIFFAPAAVRIAILGVFNGMVLIVISLSLKVPLLAARGIVRTTLESSLVNHANAQVALFKGENMQAVDKVPRYAKHKIFIYKFRFTIVLYSITQCPSSQPEVKHAESQWRPSLDFGDLIILTNFEGSRT